MSNQIPYKFLCFITVLLFISCGKEKLELPWTEVTLPSENPLTDIHFIHADTGYISGGIDWDGGEILGTTDGGMNWEILATSEFLLSGLDMDINDNVHTIGFSGKYAHRNNNWNIQQLNEYEAFTDIATWDGNEIILVGGGIFSSGRIVKMDVYGNILKRDSFQSDVDDVTFIDENNVIACGYGFVVKSDDAGDNWNILDITGDYYTDIQFPSSNIGYMCGYSGSILKSTDGGNNWNKLRDGDKILVPDKRFNALHFIDEDHGYLVGNSGLCWRTSDGGNDWQVIKGLPRFDYTEVYLIAEKAYLISKEGKLVIVEDN